MALFLFAFIAFTVLASVLGWVADSRDGADHRPSDGGRRVPVLRTRRS